MARQAPAPDRSVALFLDMIAAERGAGRNTLDAYTRDLDDLSAHLAGRGRAIASAETADLRAYLAALAGRGFKASSVARRLSAIRQLYRFLYAEGRRRDDPAAVIEGPKRGRVLPKVLSVAEVDRLLKVARAACEVAEQPPLERVRAMRLVCLLELLYATGLRVSELIALPASAARRDERMLVVRGKGDKERLVPLNNAARTAMRDYLALLAEAGRERASKWLFPSFGESGHITRQHVGRELKALAVAAGLAAGPAQPACAAPRLRQPSAAERRRSALGPDPARTRRHLHHADLHPRAGGAAEEPGARPAPARRAGPGGAAAAHASAGRTQAARRLGIFRPPGGSCHAGAWTLEPARPDRLRLRSPQARERIDPARERRGAHGLVRIGR